MKNNFHVKIYRHFFNVVKYDCVDGPNGKLRCANGVHDWELFLFEIKFLDVGGRVGKCTRQIFVWRTFKLNAKCHHRRPTDLHSESLSDREEQQRMFA